MNKQSTKCKIYAVEKQENWFCASGYDKKGRIVVEFGRTSTEALQAFIANCK